jgi:hypothetical protein
VTDDPDIRLRLHQAQQPQRQSRLGFSDHSVVDSNDESDEFWRPRWVELVSSTMLPPPASASPDSFDFFARLEMHSSLQRHSASSSCSWAVESLECARQGADCVELIDTDKKLVYLLRFVDSETCTTWLSSAASVVEIIKTLTVPSTLVRPPEPQPPQLDTRGACVPQPAPDPAPSPLLAQGKRMLAAAAVHIQCCGCQQLKPRAQYYVLDRDSQSTVFHTHMAGPSPPEVSATAQEPMSPTTSASNHPTLSSLDVAYLPPGHERSDSNGVTNDMSTRFAVPSSPQQCVASPTGVTDSVVTDLPPSASAVSHLSTQVASLRPYSRPASIMASAAGLSASAGSIVGANGLHPSQITDRADDQASTPSLAGLSASAVSAFSDPVANGYGDADEGANVLSTLCVPCMRQQALTMIASEELMRTVPVTFTAVDLSDLLPPSQYTAYLESSFSQFIDHAATYMRCPSCTTPIENADASRSPRPAPPRAPAQATCTPAALLGSPTSQAVSSSHNGGSPAHLPHHPVDQDQQAADNLLGMDNRPLRPSARVHYHLHRFLCPNPGCATNFCQVCRCTPYHTGFNCSEYREYLDAPKCRFCLEPVTSLTQLLGPDKKVLPNICNQESCGLRFKSCCVKVLPCGHACAGYVNELQCPPCLHPDCEAVARQQYVFQTSDNDCIICSTEQLGQGPVVVLECAPHVRHVFHRDCVKAKLEQRWNGAAIDFGFLNCPVCAIPLRKHPAFEDLLLGYQTLFRKVMLKALERLRFEKMDRDAQIVMPGGRFYRDPSAFALHHYAFFHCFQCKNPYYGGARVCAAADAGGDAAVVAADLICISCQKVESVDSCAVHGTDAVVHKCRFCCSNAQWLCWSNTHFCDRCHTGWSPLVEYLTGKNKKALWEFPQCPGLEGRIKEICTNPAYDTTEKKEEAIKKLVSDPTSCPLKLRHPPNGVEFGLGCGLCWDEQAKRNGAPRPLPVVRRIIELGVPGQGPMSPAQSPAVGIGAVRPVAAAAAAAARDDPAVSPLGDRPGGVGAAELALLSPRPGRSPDAPNLHVPMGGVVSPRAVAGVVPDWERPAERDDVDISLRAMVAAHQSQRNGTGSSFHTCSVEQRALSQQEERERESMSSRLCESVRLGVISCVFLHLGAHIVVHSARLSAEHRQLGRQHLSPSMFFVSPHLLQIPVRDVAIPRAPVHAHESQSSTSIPNGPWHSAISQVSCSVRRSVGRGVCLL